MTAETPEQLCSKCKTRPRADSISTNPWCLECRAEYAREYRALKKEMRESRGYAAGQSAMRDHLALMLDRLGSSMINAHDTAQWIRKQTVPED